MVRPSLCRATVAIILPRSGGRVGIYNHSPRCNAFRAKSLSLYMLERLTWSHCVTQEVGDVVESGETNLVVYDHGYLSGCRRSVEHGSMKPCFVA